MNGLGCLYMEMERLIWQAMVPISTFGKIIDILFQPHFVPAIFCSQTNCSHDKKFPVFDGFLYSG